MVAISLVLLTGWAGEISLGQVAFVAIGSAAAGAANVHWQLDPMLSFLLAGAVGAVASIIIGLPALRIRGLMLAVTTLAFAVATSSFLLNRDQSLLGIKFDYLPDSILDQVTRFPQWTPFGDIGIGGDGAHPERTFYFMCVVMLLLVIVAVRGLQRSRTVRDLIATRDNERNAQAFRLSPTSAKLLAFALAGFIASFAGGVLVLHQQALGEDIFAPIESIRVLTMVVVGGLGSIPGAILGAVFIKSTEWFNVIVPERFRFLFTFAGSGIGLIVVLWLLPGGLGSVLYRVRDKWLRRGGAATQSRRAVADRRFRRRPGPAHRQGEARGRRVDQRRRTLAARPEVPPAPPVAAGARRRLLHLPRPAAERRQAEPAQPALGRRLVRPGPGAVRREPRVAARRDHRAPRHERRRQVDRAASHLGTRHPHPRQRQPRRRRHQRDGRAPHRGEGLDPGSRRQGRVPVAHRRREPEGRALDAPPRPRVREDRRPSRR